MLQAPERGVPARAREIRPCAVRQPQPAEVPLAGVPSQYAAYKERAAGAVAAGPVCVAVSGVRRDARLAVPGLRRFVDEWIDVLASEPDGRQGKYKELRERLSAEKTAAAGGFLEQWTKHYRSNVTSILDPEKQQGRTRYCREHLREVCRAPAGRRAGAQQGRRASRSVGGRPWGSPGSGG